MKDFTRIKNDLLLALMSGPFTKNKIRVLIFILRFSEGCNKSTAILIPRDFTAIGIQETQIGLILQDLASESLILWDKEGKLMSINYEKLIETISFNEDRFIDLLSKNLRKRKVKTYRFDNKSLAESLSMDRDLLTAQSHNPSLKDNKEQLKTRNTGAEEEKQLIREGLERVKRGEKYDNSL